MRGRNIKPYVLFSILLVLSILFIITIGADFSKWPTFAAVTQPQFVYSNSINGDFFAHTLGYSGNSYYYFLKNIENDDIRDITTSIMLPDGTIVTDSGSASVEGNMITWPVSLLTPNEERTFVFGAEPFYGSVLFETTGTVNHEEEKTVNIIESIDSGEKEYERITLIGEGYISHIEFDIEVDEDSSGESDVISDPGPSGGSGKASKPMPGVTGAVIADGDKLEIYIDIDDEWNGNEELLSEAGFGIETVMKNLEEGKYSDKFYFVFDSEVDVDIEIESIEFTREFDVIESNEIIITEETDLTFSLSNIFVEDANGKILGSQIRIVDSGTKNTLSNFNIMEKDIAGAVVEGYYDVEIILEEGPIENIIFNDVYLGGDESVEFRIDDPTDNKGFTELYAIDPTLINFTTAEVTVTAKSDRLHKCKEWDFENRICNGEWEFLKTIIPGEEYTFTLTPEDPGFAEEGTHCYAVHGDYENIANHGMARTFDNVSYAIIDVGSALKSEYKWKDGGTGFETPPSNTSWLVFNDKDDANGYTSYFFTDVYTNDTVISGTVFVSAESKDKNLGDGTFNWTLYEYNETDGSYVHNFGSQTWNGTTADDPVDSQLSISNHTVATGNRLLLKVMGKLYSTPISANGELKFKVDEAGTETSTTVTSTYCSNVHNTYKSFLVLVLTEDFVPLPSVTTNTSFYPLGAAVGISGSTWDAGADVILYVYNTTSDIQSGYPKNVTVNSTGHITDSFTLPINADLGNWTINATQANDTNKNDSTLFEVSDDLYFYPPGTLIIPMDSKQNVDDSSADFMRAYGMAWRYANNSIPVEIAITPPCYKISAYNVNTSVNYSEDYCHGFFIIDDANAWSYLTTLRTLNIGGIYPFENVTVHNVTSGFNMKEEDIFFLQRPPITAILSGGEDEIITTLDPSYIPYDILTEAQVKDGTLNVNSYDILTVGHYTFDDSVLADAIKNYTMLGGNVHAECIATRTLDSYTGFVGNLASDGAVNGSMCVLLEDDLKMQTHVECFDNEGGNTPTLDVSGAIRNYTVEAIDGNYYVNNSYVKLISTEYGKGYVTYAGGHLGDVTGGLEIPRNRILDNIIFFAVETNDLTFPTWFNQNQSKDTASSNDVVYVWSNWHDNTALNVSTLSYNASGSWVNVSTQILSGKSDLSNFSISTLGFSDGLVVSWRIFANDSSGNENVTDVMSFTIDADSPDITIQSPTNSTYSNPSIWFNATTDQASDWCGYSLSGNPNVTMGGSGTSWYYFDSNVTDGFYNVNFYCNDTSGNMNSSTEYFSVLTSGPNLTISNPKNETYNIKSLNLTVVNDSTSVYCWYSLNGAANATYTCGNTVPITAVEGTNNVFVYSNNTYGTESVDSVYFFVNTSDVLAITIISPANDTYTNDVSPELTLLAVDYNYATINYTLYIYYANGTFYNTSNSGTLVNNTATVVELNQHLTLVANATTYYIVAVANDSAPNYDNSSNLYITLTDPTLDLHFPEDNYFDQDGDINFTFHYHSMSFDTMNCSLYLNGIFNQSNTSTVNDAETTFVVTGISEGNDQNWTVRCENNTAYGQVSRIFHVDNTEPIIDFVSPITSSGNHSQDYIEANVSAIDLNLDTVIVYLYNSTQLMDSVSSSSSFYNNFTGLPDGIYYLNSSANDSAGNSNSTGTTTITLDTTVPMISFVSPANTTYINSTVLINVSVTDITTDVSYAVAEINGTENITLVQNGDYWYNATYNFSDGPNTVRIYTNDSVNNWGTSQQIFSVNTGLFLENITTSPSLPTTKNNISENISVNFSSSKYPINITFNLYNSTGHLVGSQGPVQINNASELPVNYTIPAGLPDGVYSLNMTSNDTVGNNQTDFLGNFTIDSTPPVIQNVGANPEIIYETGTTTINVTVTDQLSSVDKVIIEIEYPNSTTVNYTMQDISVNLWDYDFNDTMQIGNYTYYIYTNDTVGNANSNGPYQFTVLDDMSPVYSNEITSPLSPATYVSGALYGFNITWTDDVALNEIIFEFDGMNESYLEGDIDKYGNVYHITRSNLSIGTHNYTWYANDSVGNWNSTGVLNYVVNADSSGPVIGNVIITPNPAEPGDNVTITVNVTDVSDVDVVLVNITWDATFELIEMTYNNGTGLYGTVFNNTTIEDTYNITIIANDTLGNTANVTGDFLVEEPTTPSSPASPTGPVFLPPPEIPPAPVTPTTPTVTTPEVDVEEQQLIESLADMRRQLDLAKLRLDGCSGTNILLFMILLIPLVYMYNIRKRLYQINMDAERFQASLVHRKRKR